MYNLWSEVENIYHGGQIVLPVLINGRDLSRALPEKIQNEAAGVVKEIYLDDIGPLRKLTSGSSVI